MADKAGVNSDTVTVAAAGASGAALELLAAARADATVALRALDALPDGLNSAQVELRLQQFGPIKRCRVLGLIGRKKVAYI